MVKVEEGTVQYNNLRCCAPRSFRMAWQVTRGIYFMPERMNFLLEGAALSLVFDCCFTITPLLYHYSSKLLIYPSH